MHVAIPSKGRPMGVKSLELVPSATVYVPANEEKAYRAGGARNVVGVPQSVRGITATRNWILDHVDDPWVVMVDDDVKVAGWNELRSEDGKMRRMAREDEWLREWGRLFEVTEDMGYRVWGISTDGARRSVYPYKPFLWQSYLTASCMGIRNDTSIRFDESFPVKEDYEICLRCIKEDGGIVAARYFFWVNSHWTDEGGCKEYRTQHMEEECIKRLMRMYPGLIRRVTRGGSEYSIELEF